MEITHLLTILAISGGIITALIGTIYKILNDRINSVDVISNDLLVDISAIKTDLKWIKGKLEKL